MESLSDGIAAAALDAIAVEVAILDSDGRIVLVNDAWRQFADENHGTHSDYWVGENYVAVCDRAFERPEGDDVGERLRAVCDGEADRFRLEYPCHSREQQRWFLLDAVGFTATGGDQYVLVSHHNITDSKRAKQRVRAVSEQLETALGVLSHDIRNPLQVIDGFADVLAEDLDDTEKLESIRQAAARIAEITEATIAFTRSGALSTVEPLSTADLAREAWAEVAGPEMRLLVRDPRTIHGDRRLVSQLFETLFQYAREYAGSDCTVVLGSLPDGFSVETDGPGIPDGIRDRALSTDFSTHGTGELGLAVVQTIVHGHGGELRITAAEPTGTRFEITGVTVAPD